MTGAVLRVEDRAFDLQARSERVERIVLPREPGMLGDVDIMVHLGTDGSVESRDLNLNVVVYAFRRGATTLGLPANHGRRSPRRC